MNTRKKLKLKKEVKSAILGVICFYVILIAGVILLDARMAEINKQQKSAIAYDIQMAQINR